MKKRAGAMRFIGRKGDMTSRDVLARDGVDDEEVLLLLPPLLYNAQRA